MYDAAVPSHFLNALRLIYVYDTDVSVADVPARSLLLYGDTSYSILLYTPSLFTESCVYDAAMPGTAVPCHSL